MLCTMCQHGTTDTWKCEQCGETHCRHMMWKCPDCGAKKPGSSTDADETNMILALHQGLVVGALPALEYLGADHSWPFGWKELREKVPNFDLCDADVPVEQARRMVEAYNPAHLATKPLAACEVCHHSELEVGPLSSNERHQSICDQCAEEER